MGGLWVMQDFRVNKEKRSKTDCVTTGGCMLRKQLFCLIAIRQKLLKAKPRLNSTAFIIK